MGKKSSKKPSFIRIEELPRVIDREIDKAATAIGIAWDTAVTSIFSISDLRAAVIEGLQVGDFTGLAEKRGFHTTEVVHAALKATSKSTGIRLGSCALLVLKARAGNISEAIEVGQRAQAARSDKTAENS